MRLSARRFVETQRTWPQSAAGYYHAYSERFGRFPHVIAGKRESANSLEWHEAPVDAAHEPVQQTWAKNTPERMLSSRCNASQGYNMQHNLRWFYRSVAKTAIHPLFRAVISRQLKSRHARLDESAGVETARPCRSKS
jgi:hypothetical protein